VKVWRAFRNMLRAAAQNPGWAFIAIAFAPFRATRHIIKTVLILVLVFFVVSLGGLGILTVLHLDRSLVPQYILLLIVAFAVLGAAYRLLTAPLLQHFGDTAANTHGSARFATRQEAAPLLQNRDGLLIGRDAKTGKLLRYDGPAHLLTMAPTRTGKGVGTIVPNLLTLNRSVVCIDPKGENARITGRARNGFGPVHILDPFGVTGQPSAAFNPLAGLDPHSLDVAEDAATLADALVYDAPGEAGEAHWNEEAKALIAGFALYIVSEEPQERRTLAQPCVST
jgi:type IV secretion system protein VirD4